MGMEVEECKNDGSRLAKLKHQHQHQHQQRQHRQHRQHQRTSAVSTCLAPPGLRELSKRGRMMECAPASLLLIFSLLLHHACPCWQTGNLGTLRQIAPKVTRLASSY